MRSTSTTLHDNPLVSPVFGDFSGLPPTLAQVGSTEILLDDTRRVGERARAQGVDFEVEVWDEVPHVWHVWAFLPESRRRRRASRSSSASTQLAPAAALAPVKRPRKEGRAGGAAAANRRRPHNRRRGAYAPAAPEVVGTGGLSANAARADS